jgi:hypothetical protein
MSRYQLNRDNKHSTHWTQDQSRGRETDRDRDIHRWICRPKISGLLKSGEREKERERVREREREKERENERERKKERKRERKKQEEREKVRERKRDVEYVVCVCVCLVNAAGLMEWETGFLQQTAPQHTGREG